MRKISKRGQELLFRIVAGILLCGALMTILLMTGKVSQFIDNPYNAKAPMYFGIAFVCFGLFELILFFNRFVENKGNKLVLARITYVCLFFVAAIISFITIFYPRYFPVAGTIFFLIPISKRIVSIIRNHKAKNLVVNILCLILYGVLFFVSCATIGLEGDIFFILACFLPGVFLTISALGYIIAITLSNFKSHILLKIVRKTYAVEILLGLVLLIIAFSLVLMMVEPNINSFGDALWYCYMLVTTIGFGDFTALSVVGRILSVVLGIYGIIVVAIVTSIIVNFYNEVKDEKDDEEEEKLEEQEDREIEEMLDIENTETVEQENVEETTNN